MMGAASSSSAADEYEVDPIDVLMSDASSVIASLEDPLPRLLFNLEELLWLSYSSRN